MEKSMIIKNFLVKFLVFGYCAEQAVHRQKGIGMSTSKIKRYKLSVKPAKQLDEKGWWIFNQAVLAHETMDETILEAGNWGLMTDVQENRANEAIARRLFCQEYLQRFHPLPGTPSDADDELEGMGRWLNNIYLVSSTRNSSLYK